MLCRVAFLILTTVNTISCLGQTASALQRTVYTSKYNYSDFVVVDRQIWALTTTGKLRVFDLTSGKPVQSAPQIDHKISAIGKDKDSNIIVGYEGKLMSYERIKGKWSALGTYKGDLKGILPITSKSYYLVVDSGIEDLSSQKIYFPDSSCDLNKQVHLHGSWHGLLTYFLDQNENIWIGLGFGEWGGELYIFNTVAHKFIAPQMGKYEIDLNPVKSFCSNGSAVYMSTGLQHFETSGSIVEFDHFRAISVFYSELAKGENGKVISGEYIGPSAFNETDHSIYFYSQNGIFKGNPDQDLSTIDKWNKVTSVKLYWTSGQRDAIGSPMNVYKMEFADSKTLVFATQLDGIGIYDGKTVTLVK